MSRLFSTCFGGWEDQSPQRRRRRRHHDSETESSFDSEEESDTEDEEDGDRFNRAERGEARLNSFRKEEDIRLEEVLSVDDEINRMEKYRGRISVVDDRPPPAPAPPVVSRFVEHVLRESQRGYLERRARAESPSMDVLPQVSLLHEASKLLPEGSPAFFQAAAKERDKERLSSGGSISSSGSSAAGSGRSSSSSGIGDSFTSGNDTGGSGAAGDKNKGNAVKAGELSRGKAKSKWSQVLQDVVVEENELANGLAHMSHFVSGKRGTERNSITTVEGVHFPIAPKEWGAARVLNPDPSSRAAAKIVKAFNRNRIGHHSNTIKVEDSLKSKGAAMNIHQSGIPPQGGQHSYFSDLPRNSTVSRQGVVRF